LLLSWMLGLHTKSTRMRLSELGKEVRYVAIWHDVETCLERFH
jgi:hypothetical protein